jgi:protein-S-isoprenylcysteine O-methyltransferase Ste14
LPRSLKTRGVQKLATNFVTLALLLFLPARTLRFWPAWLFLGLMLISWTAFFLIFLKRDPQLLERRLRRDETAPAQKLFQKLFSVTLVAGLLLAGFDFRFGWSRSLAPLPIALIAAGQALALAAYWFVYWVVKVNTFAGSTIQVESEHQVIIHGPYGFVRHPMYTGMALAALAIPLALGSYIALPVFGLLIPVLIYRLVHEERMLRRDLPGYSDYCDRVRFRLLPRLW